MSARDIKDSIINQTMDRLFKSKGPDSFTREKVEERKRICLECPRLTKRKIGSKLTLRYCNICKCSFPALVFAYSKKCPIEKWDSIPK